MIELPRLSDKPSSDSLSRSFGISDVLAALLIAAIIASTFPMEPPTRAAVFLTVLGIATASGWWAASVARSFNIVGFGRRLGLHLYAFVAFVCFIVSLLLIVPLNFLLMEPEPVVFLPIGAALTVSILVIEAKRIAIEKRRREDASKVATAPVAPSGEKT